MPVIEQGIDLESETHISSDEDTLGSKVRVNNVLTCSTQGRCSSNSLWPLGDHFAHCIELLISSCTETYERQQDASSIRVL